MGAQPYVVGHHEKEKQVAKLESFGRGWLGVGFQAPLSAVMLLKHAACQAGTYVDWLRAAVTRVPLDGFVYARRPKGGGRLASLQRGPRRLGLEGYWVLLGECRVRLSPTPSASTAERYQGIGRQTLRARACHAPSPSAVFPFLLIATVWSYYGITQIRFRDPTSV